jgi:hypothetical protein
MLNDVDNTEPKRTSPARMLLTTKEEFGTVYSAKLKREG